MTATKDDTDTPESVSATAPVKRKRWSRRDAVGPLANGQRVVLNLIGDEEFRNVVDEGLAEYIGRYRTSASTKSILPEALQYISSFSGDEVWHRVHDKYTYDQQKKLGINLSPELNAKLEETVDRLKDSSRDTTVRERWSKRTVGVAAIYLYCLYLIVHNGNKYVMPHDQVVEYIGENRKA
ncbi:MULTISPECIES: hypothetical protein [Asticcacaulis]|uniref:hypothetical protein n=1 Tax=Asticcacaulis TaxID=76890 RepID=UPI001AE99D97|nr:MULTISPECIES: hypothetical protein [Asticcacaulis]MBP2160562.1 hypothetical protein [Asticcacaulis solisilvae]MDR6801607.1 hypothetical protein [Asticcacaulis sp. BE141]